MIQKSVNQKPSSERMVKGIRRATRRIDDGRLIRGDACAGGRVGSDFRVYDASAARLSNIVNCRNTFDDGHPRLNILTFRTKTR